MFSHFIANEVARRLVIDLVLGAIVGVALCILL